MGGCLTLILMLAFVMWLPPFIRELAMLATVIWLIKEGFKQNKK